ncbi:leucyl aminopeptidase, partial [Patescibacteria group bacterium]|nr:leucyl aminopeptidase [Patescibacteria group bacterium]
KKIEKNEIGKIGTQLILKTKKSEIGHILLVGMGESVNVDNLQGLCGVVTQNTELLKAEKIIIHIPKNKKIPNKTIIYTLASALRSADYKFVKYKTKNNKTNEKTIVLAVDGMTVSENMQAVLKLVDKISEGTSEARDLVNLPSNILNPKYLAQKASEIAQNSTRIKVKILDSEQCKKKQMNAYLAVSQGSAEDPYFIHLSYKPKKSNKKIVIIGKGITFDSGGLSLKPSKSMEAMKCDMAGAAAVLGVFSVIEELHPEVEVHGIIAAAENMPSSRAVKPGDIVVASNKKTIEILNTDAEGRLTLADALVYGSKLKPDVMLDLATLTGAAVVALGEEIAAIMSNDAKLAENILKVAKEAGEKMWQLPLEEKYRILLDSEVADLRNISKSSYGGTLTAGLFLQEFVGKDLKWAHIDIAGPDFAERPFSVYTGIGATGYGVSTVLHLILKY